MTAVQKFFFYVSSAQILIILMDKFVLDFGMISLALLSLLIVAAIALLVYYVPQLTKSLRKEMPLITQNWQIILIVFQLAVLANVFCISFIVERFFSEDLSLAFHYVRLLCCFHLAEFVFIVLHRPWQIEIDSFVIYNNKFYLIASVFSAIEFAVELYFFPKMKLWLLAHWKIPRILFACAGLLIRWASFQKLKANFNHLIKFNDSQELVKTGIYAYERHPSYVGYYFFALGLQSIIGNPLSLLLFAAILWKFFRSRILIEEYQLSEKYGTQYSNYKQNVSSIFDFKAEDLTGDG